MNKTDTTRLPRPRWFFLALAVPTFYMPLAYLVLAVWTISGISGGGISDPPAWIVNMIQPAPYVTAALWPVYLTWLGFSKILTWREKGLWLFIVILLNMLGMPMFYIFMIRRHLGVEGRTDCRDEMALEVFLDRCNLQKDSLSPDEIAVLRSYCRKRRFAKYGLGPMIVLSGLLFYTAIVFAPRNCVRLFSDSSPTRVVIIDSANDTKKEMKPDPETEKLHIQNIMILGAMAGMTGAMGFLVLIQAISQVWGNWHSRSFIEYLKATGKKHSTSGGGHHCSKA